MSMMTANDFLLELEKKGWNIDKNIPNKSNLSERVLSRIDKTPAVFNNFINYFTSCANEQDTIWFLSIADYTDNEDIAFPWDEFEQQSLEAAGDDNSLIKEVEFYWEKHLPFLMSVKSNYLYVSICIDKNHFGKIFYGSEPEYEENILIAESIEEFFINYINALDGNMKQKEYELLI